MYYIEYVLYYILYNYYKYLHIYIFIICLYIYIPISLYKHSESWNENGRGHLPSCCIMRHADLRGMIYLSAQGTCTFSEKSLKANHRNWQLSPAPSSVWIFPDRGSAWLSVCPIDSPPVTALGQVYNIVIRGHEPQGYPKDFASSMGQEQSFDWTQWHSKL